MTQTIDTEPKITLAETIDQLHETRHHVLTPAAKQAQKMYLHTKYGQLDWAVYLRKGILQGIGFAIGVGLVVGTVLLVIYTA